MLRIFTLAYSCAIVLSFISRIFAFLFSPEAGDTDGSFTDIMGRKNTKHNIQKTLATLYTVDYQLFNLIIMGAATAQYHKRESYCTSPAEERAKIQNLKYNFY